MIKKVKRAPKGERRVIEEWQRSKASLVVLCGLTQSRCSTLPRRTDRAADMMHSLF